MMPGEKIALFGLWVLFSGVGVIDCENDVLQMSLFPSLPIAVFKSDNMVCREHSDLYLDNLKNFTLWAHESKNETLTIGRGNEKIDACEINMVVVIVLVLVEE